MQGIAGMWKKYTNDVWNPKLVALCVPASDNLLWQIRYNSDLR
jgi:hypothetical protein